MRFQATAWSTSIFPGFVLRWETKCGGFSVISPRFDSWKYRRPQIKMATCLSLLSCNLCALQPCHFASPVPLALLMLFCKLSSKTKKKEEVSGGKRKRANESAAHESSSAPVSSSAARSKRAKKK
jgi:hypothetical protein